MTQVVLLHAFPVNRHLWDAQVEYLTKVGFKVTAPDLGGFGDSRAPQDPTISAMAEQALSHVSRPAVFVGLSMGGYLLMEILRQAPEVVTGAVFMDTKATADPDEAPDAAPGRGAGGAGSRSHARPGRGDAAATCSAPPPGAQRPDVVDRVRTWIENAPAEAVVSAQRAMAGRPDSVPTLRTLRGPGAGGVGVRGHDLPAGRPEGVPVGHAAGSGPGDPSRRALERGGGPPTMSTTCCSRC